MWVSDMGGKGQDREEGEWDKCFNVFSSVTPGREGEGTMLCCQTTSAPMGGGLWFDDTLETLMLEGEF